MDVYSLLAMVQVLCGKLGHEWKVIKPRDHSMTQFEPFKRCSICGVQNHE